MVDSNESVSWSTQFKDKPGLSKENQSILVTGDTAKLGDCHQQSIIKSGNHDMGDITLNSNYLINPNVIEVENVTIHRSNVNGTNTSMGSDFEKKDKNRNIPNPKNHGCKDGIGIKEESTENSVLNPNDMEHDGFVSSMRLAVETEINTAHLAISAFDNHGIKISEEETGRMHQSNVNETSTSMGSYVEQKDKNRNIPNPNNHGCKDGIGVKEESTENLVLISNDMEHDQFISCMRQAVDTVTNSTQLPLSACDEHERKISKEDESDKQGTGSSSEDDSDESSSVSSTTSDELVEDEEIVPVTTEPNVLEIDIQESPATKFEKVLLEAEPEIKEVTDIILPCDAKLEMIGQISGLIENSVVVIKGLLKKPALNLDSILFLEDRSVLGQIYETFGPVSSPFYVVCFKDGKPPEALSTGQDIYFAPEMKDFTSYVLTAQLESVKGSDASWQNDKEPPEDAVEYSDDEKEKIAKRNKKIVRQMNNDKADDDAGASEKPTRRVERPSRGRGRGNWTNRSIRYVNPSQTDDSQVGWMNTVSNPHTRRIGAGAMGFPPQPQGYLPQPMYGRFPYQFPPCFHPMYGGPPQNFHPMMMVPPPPPPPPPPHGHETSSFQSENQPLPPQNVMYYTHPPPLSAAPISPTTVSDTPLSSS